MYDFAFKPAIDLPLGCAVLLALLLHFGYWARSNTADTNLDLRSRLPTARFRVTCFILALVGVCWISNFAVWAVLGSLVFVGFIAAFLSGDGQASGMLILFTVVMIREWSFGFPQLVLHPKPDADVAGKQSDLHSRLIGQNGIVSAPLRPFGEAELNGERISVVSENGQQIDIGANIVVTSFRSGQVYVRVKD